MEEHWRRIGGGAMEIFEPPGRPLRSAPEVQMASSPSQPVGWESRQLASSESPQVLASASTHDPCRESTKDCSPPPKKALKKRRTRAKTDGDAKPLKKRAARACASCRSRKVRCNVVTKARGERCSNCCLDNLVCEVQESKRRKKGDCHPIAVVDSQPQTPSQSLVTTSPALRVANPRTNYYHQMDASDDEDHHKTRITSPSEVRRVSNEVEGGMAQLAAVDGDGAMMSQFVHPMCTQHMGTDGMARNDLGPNTDLHHRQLPPFIRPLPGKMLAEDAKYLKSKGALTTPSRPCLGALLSAYVQFVHPYMPVLEVNKVLNTICCNGKAGQISLLLFQAVVFAASAFVEGCHLSSGGFENRKEARKQFFLRARLLYDFDYESDRVIATQALLLMTYWYETPDDAKDTWHWMGIAISLGNTIGLHRNPEHTMPRATAARKRLLKRMWYSCYMRDRLIALGMRRATRINDEDFDVSMLDESDFEIEALDPSNKLVDCRVVRDPEMQRQLVQMCIEMARLTRIISTILRLQYSVLTRDTSPDSNCSTTVMLFPNKTCPNLDGVHRAERELLKWEHELPKSCQYRPLQKGLDDQAGCATVAVHRSMLQMLYHTTMSALHRPQYMGQTHAGMPLPPLVVETSRCRVHTAAAAVTAIFRELDSLDMICYLPTTAVTVLLPALIMGVMGAHDQNAQLRQRCEKDYHFCMGVLDKLRDCYASADFAAGFMKAAKSRTEGGSGSGNSGQVDQDHLQHQHPQHRRGIPQQQPNSFREQATNGVLAPGLNLTRAQQQSPVSAKTATSVMPRLVLQQSGRHLGPLHPGLASAANEVAPLFQSRPFAIDSPPQLTLSDGSANDNSGSDNPSPATVYSDGGAQNSFDSLIAQMPNRDVDWGNLDVDGDFPLLEFINIPN